MLFGRRALAWEENTRSFCSVLDEVLWESIFAERRQQCKRRGKVLTKLRVNASVG